MESFVLDATCALMLWDQGHRRGTTCARERTEWGHFCGCAAAGAAQQPLCQAAKTQVGNKVKSRDQHLPGALSGQAFPLRKRAAKDAVSKDPNSLVQIRAPLAATSSIKLSLAGTREYWQERSSIVHCSSTKHAAHQPHHQPGAITAGSCSLGNETSAGWLKGFVYCYRNGNS